jgi:hypothetical protein
MGTTALPIAGGAAIGAGIGTLSAPATAATLGGGGMVGTAAAAGLGLILIGPALMVGGIARGVNNSRVDGEIQRRQTAIPLPAPTGIDVNLDLFFPLTPSPGHIAITYTIENLEYQLDLATATVLAGLNVHSE